MILKRCSNVADLFFGEVFTCRLDLVEKTAIDPRCVLAAVVDGDSLFAESDVIGWVGLFDIVVEECVAIPGGAFFGESEGRIFWAFKVHSDSVFFVGSDVD